MVNFKFKFQFQFSFMAIFTLALTGCSANKWWGEPPAPKPIIELNSSHSACSHPGLILEGTEEESQNSLQCLISELDKLWTEIKPSQDGYFSENELETLFKKQIISTSGDPQENFQKLLSLFKLLGFQTEGLSKSDYNSWIEFVRQNRKETRALFQIFRDKDLFEFNHYEKAFQLAKNYLHKTNWHMSPEILGSHLKTFFSLNDPDLLKILLPALRFSWNAIGMTCPTVSDLTSIHGREIAQCLEILPRYFRPAKLWLEHTLNPITVSPDIKSIAISLRSFETLAEKWFQQKELHPLKTQTLIDLVENLGAKPPENFYDSLELLSKLDKSSNKDSIHPLATHRIIQILRRTGLSVLEELPVFFKTLENKKCINQDATTWKNCTLPTQLPELQEVLKKSQSFQTALKIRNPHYGEVATPFNGKRFQRILMFNAIAEHFIDIFDTDGPAGVPDGLIISEGKNDKDEVVQMLSLTLESIDSIERFISNLKRKLNGLSVVETSPRLSLKQFDLKGLAQLLTFFTTDLLVQRSPKEKISLEKLIGGLFKTFVDLSPESSIFLDQLSIASLINYIDGLGSYREGYLSIASSNEDSETVERSKIIASLTKMIETFFPRTYQGCKKFGFHKSCGIVFDELLSDPSPDGTISRNDLDLITIIASLMEGLLDACDLNKNAYLELNLLEPINLFSDGDELSCATKKISTAVNRLIHSKIIQDIHSIEASRLLNFLKTNELTRVFGKVSIIDGSTRFMLLSPIRVHFEALRGILTRSHGKADLGSMYGLFADILNSKRARATEANAE